jgi:hypothetical protein
MTTALNIPTELDEVDREALQRSLAMTLVEPDRTKQIQSMLKERDWFEVASFASYDQQSKNLQCKPWESPPCWIGGYHEVESEYLEIGKRLVQAGLSLFEPDPLKALQDAEKKQVPRAG